MVFGGLGGVGGWVGSKVGGEGGYGTYQAELMDVLTDPRVANQVAGNGGRGVHPGHVYIEESEYSST